LFFWIYDIPLWLLGTLFTIVFVGVTSLSVIVLQRPLRRWMGPFADNYNEIIGNLVSGYMSLYGILLALIAVGAYQNLNDVDSTVSSEASNLGALYRDVSSYPEPARTQLTGELREYCRFVIERGWPQYQKGNIPQEGTTRVTEFQKELFSFEPKTKSEEILHAEAIHQFNVFAEVRRRRIHNVTSGLPPILWQVVGIGALLGILMTSFFSFEKLSFHLVVAGILWCFTGLVVFLIAAMDYPLRGTVSISSESFQYLLRVLMAQN
jgi:hypothetical protein